MRTKPSGVAEHRQRDVAEPLPGAGAVDCGRFVQAAGDLLEAGEEDHHVEPEVLPHGDEHDGGHGEHRVLQHVAELDAEASQPVVEQPDLRVEQVRPREGGDGERDDERQEQRGAEERRGTAGVGLFSEQGERERDAPPPAG